MKVRVLDRIIIFFVSLLFLALAAALALYAWKVVPAEVISFYLQALQGYWVNTVLFTAAALALALVAIRLFVSACRRDVPEKKANVAVIGENEAGTVSIALTTVVNLAKTFILAHPGVKTAHVFVNKRGSALTMKVKLAVEEESAIPELTRMIQTDLAEKILQVTGLKLDGISILVDDRIAPRAQAPVRK